jgi:hypothetical protein
MKHWHETLNRYPGPEAPRAKLPVYAHLLRRVQGELRWSVDAFSRAHGFFLIALVSICLLFLVPYLQKQKQNLSPVVEEVQDFRQLSDYHPAAMGDYFTSMALLPNKRLALGTGAGGLQVYDSDSGVYGLWRSITQESTDGGLPSDKISDLRYFNDRLWVAAGGTLSRVNPRFFSWQKIFFPWQTIIDDSAFPGAAQETINIVEQSSDGRLLFAGTQNNGLGIYDTVHHHWTVLDGAHELYSSTIQDLQVTNSLLWVATSGGLNVFDLSQAPAALPHRTDLELPGIDIHQLTIQSDLAMIVSGNNGAQVLQGNWQDPKGHDPWQTIAGEKGFPALELESTTISAATLWNQYLFVGTQGQGLGLYNIRQHEWQVFDAPKSIYGLVQFQDQVWACTDSGVRRYRADDNQWESITLPVQSQVIKMRVYGQNLYAITTSGELAVYQGSPASWQVLVGAGLAVDDFSETMTAVEGYGSELWFATSAGTLASYDPTKHVYQRRDAGAPQLRQVLELKASRSGLLARMTDQSATVQSIHAYRWGTDQWQDLTPAGCSVTDIEENDSTWLLCEDHRLYNATADLYFMDGSANLIGRAQTAALAGNRLYLVNDQSATSYDLATHSWKDASNALSSTVASLSSDNSRLFAVSTWGGLSVFDPQTSQNSVLQGDLADSLSGSTVTPVTFDSFKGLLWFALPDGRLFSYDPVSYQTREQTSNVRSSWYAPQQYIDQRLRLGKTTMWYLARGQTDSTEAGGLWSFDGENWQAVSHSNEVVTEFALQEDAAWYLNADGSIDGPAGSFFAGGFNFANLAFAQVDAQGSLWAADREGQLFAYRPHEHTWELVRSFDSILSLKVLPGSAEASDQLYAVTNDGLYKLSSESGIPAASADFTGGGGIDIESVNDETFVLTTSETGNQVYFTDYANSPLIDGSSLLTAGADAQGFYPIGDRLVALDASGKATVYDLANSGWGVEPVDVERIVNSRLTGLGAFLWGVDDLNTLVQMDTLESQGNSPKISRGFWYGLRKYFWPGLIAILLIVIIVTIYSLMDKEMSNGCGCIFYLVVVGYILYRVYSIAWVQPWVNGLLSDPCVTPVSATQVGVVGTKLWVSLSNDGACAYAVDMQKGSLTLVDHLLSKKEIRQLYSDGSRMYAVVQGAAGVSDSVYNLTKKTDAADAPSPAAAAVKRFSNRWQVELEPNGQWTVSLVDLKGKAQVLRSEGGRFLMDQVNDLTPFQNALWTANQAGVTRYEVSTSGLTFSRLYTQVDGLPDLPIERCAVDQDQLICQTSTGDLYALVEDAWKLYTQPASFDQYRTVFQDEVLGAQIDADADGHARVPAGSQQAVGEHGFKLDQISELAASQGQIIVRAPAGTWQWSAKDSAWEYHGALSNETQQVFDAAWQEQGKQFSDGSFDWQRIIDPATRMDSVRIEWLKNPGRLRAFNSVGQFNDLIFSAVAAETSSQPTPTATLWLASHDGMWKAEVSAGTPPVLKLIKNYPLHASSLTDLQITTGQGTLLARTESGAIYAFDRQKEQWQANSLVSWPDRTVLSLPAQALTVKVTTTGVQLSPELSAVISLHFPFDLGNALASDEKSIWLAANDSIWQYKTDGKSLEPVLHYSMNGGVNDLAVQSGVVYAQMDSGEIEALREQGWEAVAQEQTPFSDRIRLGALPGPLRWSGDRQNGYSASLGGRPVNFSQGKFSIDQVSDVLADGSVTDQRQTWVETSYGILAYRGAPLGALTSWSPGTTMPDFTLPTSAQGLPTYAPFSQVSYEGGQWRQEMSSSSDFPLSLSGIDRGAWISASGKFTFDDVQAATSWQNRIWLGTRAGIIQYRRTPSLEIEHQARDWPAQMVVARFFQEEGRLYAVSPTSEIIQSDYPGSDTWYFASDVTPPAIQKARLVFDEDRWTKEWFTPDTTFLPPLLEIAGLANAFESDGKLAFDYILSANGDTTKISLLTAAGPVTVQDPSLNLDQGIQFHLVALPQAELSYDADRRVLSTTTPSGASFTVAIENGQGVRIHDGESAPEFYTRSGVFPGTRYDPQSLADALVLIDDRDQVWLLTREALFMVHKK